MTTTEINWRQVVRDLRELPDRDMAAAFRGSMKKWLRVEEKLSGVKWQSVCDLCVLSGWRRGAPKCYVCPLVASGESYRLCTSTPFEDLYDHTTEHVGKYRPDCPECNRLRIAELHTIIKSLRWFAARESK